MYVLSYIILGCVRDFTRLVMVSIITCDKQAIDHVAIVNTHDTGCREWRSRPVNKLSIIVTVAETSLTNTLVLDVPKGHVG